MNKSKGEHRPILGPDGKPMIVGRIVPASAGPAERPRWEHDPENPTHKLPPVLRLAADEVPTPRPRHVEQLEELDEATHQFVGEVAELGELILDEGLSCLMPDDRGPTSSRRDRRRLLLRALAPGRLGFNPFRVDG
jgi:hypothetical protein